MTVFPRSHGGEHEVAPPPGADITSLPEEAVEHTGPHPATDPPDPAEHAS